MQFVLARAEPPWREVDLTDLPAGERDAALAAVAERERLTRFAMAEPPLLRFMLVRMSPADHRLVLTNHHVVWDGWSFPVLVGELFALYADRGRSAPSGRTATT